MENIKKEDIDKGFVVVFAVLIVVVVSIMILNAGMNNTALIKTCNNLASKVNSSNITYAVLWLGDECPCYTGAVIPKMFSSVNFADTSICTQTNSF